MSPLLAAAHRQGAGPIALSLALVALFVGWANPDQLPPWRSLGIVSAWAGCALLVASLLLMVREPRLAHWLGGLESMYLWHHRSGVLGYVLLLVHPLALAAAERVDSPQGAWNVLDPRQQSWPLWSGWLALLLLMLGLATAFSRRLAYRRWLGLHQTLGLGALVGWVHVLALLGDLPLAMAGALLAGGALAWRWLVVDTGRSAHLYRVADVHQAAIGVVECRLVPLAGTLVVAPGQFVLARFVASAAYRSCDEFHPFTVSGIGPHGELQVAIKALGRCSARIQGIAPGMAVRLQGPFGDFLDSRDQGPQLWVAGGIGITPFIAALRQRPRNCPTTLVYLFVQQAGAAFAEELHDLAAHDPQLELLMVPTGSQPPELDPLLDRVADLDHRIIQVCGPSSLVSGLTERLSARGVPDPRIHHERFDFR